MAWRVPLAGSLGMFLVLASVVGGVGQVPSQPDAIHSPIVIDGNTGFTAANGVASGSGTPSDPYLIENWTIEIDASYGIGIDIRNTTAAFVVRNVQIRTTSASVFHPIGVTIQNVTGARFDRVILTSLGTGFASVDSRGVAVIDSIFTMPRFPDGLVGMDFDRSADVLIHNVNVSGEVPEGIVALRVANMTVETSVVSDVLSAGLWARHSTNISVLQNVFQRTAMGASVENSTNLTLYGNLFESGWYGIQLVSARGVEISRNEVRAASQAAMYFATDSRYPTLTQSVRVFHNNFIDNTRQIDLGPADVVWDDGYPSGGNHWSDHVAPDRCRGPLQDDCSNRDGIVDTPFQGTPSRNDRYPLVRPYKTTNSPPTASLVLSPTSGDTDTDFSLNASASSDPNDPLQFLEARWDFDGDGIFDTNWSSSMSVTHRYGVPQVYRPRVEVRDTDGASSLATGRIDVNVPPIQVAVLVGIGGLIAAAIVAFLVWRIRGRRNRSRDPK